MFDSSNQSIRKESDSTLSKTQARIPNQTGDWMIKIDLKDAYFTAPVSNQHQPLLRLMHGGLRYQFSCLPFGLGPAPRLFTKLLKPVVALLRRLGLRLIIYLDNIIVYNQTQEGIVRDRDSTLWLLQHLGSTGKKQFYILPGPWNT